SRRRVEGRDSREAQREGRGADARARGRAGRDGEGAEEGLVRPAQEVGLRTSVLGLRSPGSDPQPVPSAHGGPAGVGAGAGAAGPGAAYTTQIADKNPSLLVVAGMMPPRGLNATPLDDVLGAALLIARPSQPSSAARCAIAGMRSSS